MIERNLLKDPFCDALDLGQAIPQSPHAVSVALPRWEDVLAYEEKDPACLNALQSIYPRFGLNPLVKEIAETANELNGEIRNSAWPYPNIKTAQKAQAFCQRMQAQSYTIIKEVSGLQCLIVDAQATPAAKAFW